MRKPVDASKLGVMFIVNNAPMMANKEAALVRETYIRKAAHQHKAAHGEDGAQRFQKVGHAGVILDDLIELCRKNRQGIRSAPDEDIQALKTHPGNGNIVCVKDDGSVVTQIKDNRPVESGLGFFKKQKRGKDMNSG